MLIKYLKNVFWRVAKCLSYIEEARCLKVKLLTLYRKVDQKYMERKEEGEKKGETSSCTDCVRNEALQRV